ncbi:Cytoplasmic dynein 1 light intermediate chain 2, partial [Globisporangium splendens]
MATTATMAARDGATGTNLWQQILRESSVRSKVPMANLLVVGDTESGKSALLTRLDESVIPQQGPQDPQRQPHAIDTLLAYSTMNVIDPKAKESGGDASDDIIAKIRAWRFNDLNVKDLIRIAAKPHALKHWSSALEGGLLHQINQLPPDARNELYGAIKQHILTYEDPMEEGVLSKNLGVPLILIVAKADTGANIDALREYILHRAYPSQFKFTQSPQLVERGAILVPSGYDSFHLVDQSLLGSQPRWSNDKPFEKMVPAPHDTDVEDPAALLAADIRVDKHDRWLEKLEKAAGAGLEELQKQSVEASKKAEAAAAARRAAADRRKREEKDVSSKHLANFFNNLLSRPEKSKSSRALSDAKKVRQTWTHVR